MVKWNRHIAIGFVIGGLVSWYWPGFNGIFFSSSDISVGDGRIIGAVFIVGGAILWFIRPAPDP
jgi:hypothetical protein